MRLDGRAIETQCVSQHKQTLASGRSQLVRACAEMANTGDFVVRFVASTIRPDLMDMRSSAKNGLARGSSVANISEFYVRSRGGV